jgi:hypothetical protein
MQPDTNNPMPIDPQLTDTTRLTAQPVALPTRTHDDAEAGADDADGERQDGSEKRQKLNLWKCKQCRDARKKVWYSSGVRPVLSPLPLAKFEGWK